MKLCFCFISHRLDWAWDSFPGLYIHLWWLWDHQYHARFHPLQPGHQPWCAAHLAGGNWCKPTKRCKEFLDVIYYNLNRWYPSVLILICSIFPLGPHFVWGSDGSTVPGPGSLWVTAFDSHCPSTWKDMQENCPGPRPHHPWRNPCCSPCAPFTQGPTLLELTWTFSTREVCSCSSHQWRGGRIEIQKM